MKQSFRITTSTGQRLHLISYRRSHPAAASLRRPSTDPALRYISPQKDLYPESVVNDQSILAAVNRRRFQEAAYPRSVVSAYERHGVVHPHSYTPPNAWTPSPLGTVTTITRPYGASETQHTPLPAVIGRSPPLAPNEPGIYGRIPLHRIHLPSASHNNYAATPVHNSQVTGQAASATFPSRPSSRTSEAGGLNSHGTIRPSETTVLSIGALIASGPNEAVLPAPRTAPTTARTLAPSPVVPKQVAMTPPWRRMSRSLTHLSKGSKITMLRRPS
jgi:hypothetical protein